MTTLLSPLPHAATASPSPLMFLRCDEPLTLAVGTFEAFPRLRESAEWLGRELARPLTLVLALPPNPPAEMLQRCGGRRLVLTSASGLGAPVPEPVLANSWGSVCCEPDLRQAVIGSLQMANAGDLVAVLGPDRSLVPSLTSLVLAGLRWRSQLAEPDEGWYFPLPAGDAA